MKNTHWFVPLLAAVGWLLAFGAAAPAVATEGQSARTAADQARIEAVLRFADNVLENGRDRYGDRSTPLFVDGLNVDTLEPVRWVYKGQEWIPSNLASQQNLFRTLVGLSNLTGDARYQRAARDAIAYHFEHLRSPCGLLYWGGHRFFDLRTLKVVGEQNSHELKFNLPFYELMWEVDPAATELFLKAFWNAHVLQLAQSLGEEGAEFLAWTRDGLRACAQYIYDAETNTVRPLWADGTDLTDYVVKRDGYYGKAGTVFRAQEASTLLFWSYALGHRLTGDGVLWETARSIARGQGLGDLGSAPGEDVRVDLDTENADPLALFGVLEVCRAADVPAYRDLARRLGDNIVKQRFHDGFFLPDDRHVNANFNTLEPLALLSLEAMLRGTPQAVPPYNGGRGYIHGPHDGLGRTTDATAIWSEKRKSSE